MTINYRRRIVDGMKYKIGGKVYRSVKEIANYFLVDVGTVNKWIELELPSPNGYKIELIKYKKNKL